VFNDAVVSASQDPVSGIVDIVGAGPYSATQIGQCIRFTSGTYAAYNYFGLFAPIPVDVYIVDVPTATTLRIAFTGTPLPSPGDTFVVESIDTQVNIITFSTIIGQEYLLFSNLVFNNAVPLAGVAGFIVESSTMCVMHAVTISNTGSGFIFSGYDGCTFMGGLTEFYNFNATGVAPTTQSLMF